jgi:hypothetical protein
VPETCRSPIRRSLEMTTLVQNEVIELHRVQHKFGSSCSVGYHKHFYFDFVRQRLKRFSFTV